MENISKNLFNSEVKLIFNSCVNENFYIEQYIYPIVSSKFFFKRLLSTTYSSYTIKPITFVDALVNTSKIMGDNFLGLSFSGFFEEDLPRHSIITISEFKEKNLSDLVLKDLSKIFPDAGCQSINCAVYSLQGNWAAVTQVVDYYGTIGMSAEFVENLRKIYPQLDKELDDQLFDFIRYFNDLPDDWQWTKELDEEICNDYFREIIKYLNDLPIVQETNYDLIEQYRNKYK